MTSLSSTTTVAPVSQDRAYDILRTEYQPLNAIFAPKTVAVIGATEKPGSVGRTILWNLLRNPFGGTIFPVNPKRPSVLGIKAYPTVFDTPSPVDLAIIATPAPTVPGLIGECADAGVKGAIVLSAGFKEIGPAGVELEQHTLAEARRGHLRIIGPNCLGVMNPHYGLNATFASEMANPGNVGFLSQSGALCTSILDWSFRENVGFSTFVSIGSMLDVDWGDLIYYLGDDPHTNSIVIYMESIGNAASFLSAAREVALSKPIIVIKSGRTEAAAQASASHTGALTGSDDVLDAAFRRCGVLRVDSIDDLFNMAEILAKEPRPKGPKLTILTNAGGPGVLATDTLIRGGGELAPLSDQTIDQLNGCLPTHWSHGNPIDILGDADPDRYAKAIKIAAENPDSDGLLVILTPQAMTQPTAIAEELKHYGEYKQKPLLASWMGGAAVAPGESLLNRANIFTFPYPDTAASVFNLMWRYSYSLRGLYETPAPLPPDEVDEHKKVPILLDKVRQTGRTLLTEAESKEVLTAYGIPCVDTRVATTAAEAVSLAEQMGYPVVLKLWSETITHKSDVGGVQLNLQNAAAVHHAFETIVANVSHYLQRAITVSTSPDFLGVTVQPMIKREGYELIIGSSLDVQFGPVLVFGTGGYLVEIFRDRAIALPPLNTTLARRLMEQTQIYKALQGIRGEASVDLEQLEQLLVRFSHLVVEHPWIKEIDINPLQIKPPTKGTPGSMLALDARVVLHAPDVPEDQIPKPAIRPYPIHYVAPWTTQGDIPVTFRPIRPEDEPLMVQFHTTLSEESVYLRYFHLMKLSRRIAHERLTRICFADYDRDMALVAEHIHPDGQAEILAAGRLSKLHGRNEAEFAMLVSDRYQKQGLGTELLKRLVQVGRDEKVDSIRADVLLENQAMQKICERVGFKLSPVQEGIVEVKLVL